MGKLRDIVIAFLTTFFAITIYEYISRNFIPPSLYSRRSSGSHDNGDKMATSSTPAKSVSKYSITEFDSNYTVATSNPTAAVMSSIGKYKVPRHTKIILNPDDYLVFTGTDSIAAALADASQFQLVLTDPNGIKTEILRNGVYGEVKTIGDLTKRFSLGIYKQIEDDFILDMQVKTVTVTASAAAQHLILTCTREADIA